MIGRLYRKMGGDLSGLYRLHFFQEQEYIKFLASHKGILKLKDDLFSF